MCPVTLALAQIKSIATIEGHVIFLRTYSNLEIYLFSDNSQLDDLYTRYRQRLRKSLFVSGLTTALFTCLFSIFFCLNVSTNFSFTSSSPIYSTKYIFILISTVNGRHAADGVWHHRDMRCTDSVAISRCDVIAIDGAGFCGTHHLCTGHCGRCGGWNGRTSATLRVGLGKWKWHSHDGVVDFIFLSSAKTFISAECHRNGRRTHFSLCEWKWNVIISKWQVNIHMIIAFNWISTGSY